MKILPLLYTIPICNRVRIYLARKRLANRIEKSMRSGKEIMLKREELYKRMLEMNRIKSSQELLLKAQIEIIDWVIGEVNP